MVNQTLEIKGITKECASYCMRSIVKLLNGNIRKFEEYVDKAIVINTEVVSNANWQKCLYSVNGKKVHARINLATGEIRSIDDNAILRGARR